MSAVALPSEAGSFEAACALGGIRVRGRIGAAFAATDRRTRIAHLEEHGGYRLRFPHTHGSHAEAVIINTGGGVVGGDDVELDFRVGAGARAVVSTQSAERIYRSAGPHSRIRVSLTAASGGRLHWLPQETILFSGARLARHFEVDVAADAAALLIESLVLGRAASGETMRSGRLHDVWRVRRNGSLVLADVLRLERLSAATLDRPAVLDGARAAAMLLYVAPDAEVRLAAVREAMGEARGEWGASAWYGMLAMRFLARAPQHVRSDLMRAALVLSGMPMPRVWAT
jgi:urease accessory protein